MHTNRKLYPMGVGVLEAGKRCNLWPHISVKSALDPTKGGDLIRGHTDRVII